MEQTIAMLDIYSLSESMSVTETLQPGEYDSTLILVKLTFHVISASIWIHAKQGGFMGGGGCLS